MDDRAPGEAVEPRRRRLGRGRRTLRPQRVRVERRAADVVQAARADVEGGPAGEPTEGGGEEVALAPQRRRGGGAGVEHRGVGQR